MSETWFLATLWVSLALMATMISLWLRVATALSEIVVGTTAQLVLGTLISPGVLGVQEPWIKFLAGTGAIVLTFFTYAFVNMGMVSGILPVVGVPLPLVSYGGTSMVSVLIGFGIVMSAASHKKLVKT